MDILIQGALCQERTDPFIDCISGLIQADARGHQYRNIGEKITLERMGIWHAIAELTKESGYALHAPESLVFDPDSGVDTGPRQTDKSTLAVQMQSQEQF